MIKAAIHLDRSTWWLLLALLVPSIVRVVFALQSYPDWMGDSVQYFALAANITHLNFDGYDGLRTPGFPLLVAALASNLDAVHAAQSVLGVCTCALLCWLLFKRTESVGIAFAATTLFGLSRPQICFESAMMSETLSTFLLMLTLYWFVKTRLSPNLWNFLLLGGLVGLEVITRPSFSYLVLLYGIFIVADSNLRKNKSGIATFFVTACAFPLFWCCFNFVTVGSFTLTTLSGHSSLITHAFKYLESADDDKLHLKEALIEKRDALSAKWGQRIIPFTLWLADKELNESTHTTIAQRGPIIQTLALQVITRHPIEYLGSVREAWSIFWQPSSIQMEPAFVGAVHNQVLDQVGTTMWHWQDNCWLRLRWLMLPVVGLQLFWSCKARDAWTDFDLLIVSVILALAASQAILAIGDNSRYAICVEPLIDYLYFTTGWRLLAELGGRRKDKPSKTFDSDRRV